MDFEEKGFIYLPGDRKGGFSGQNELHEQRGLVWYLFKNATLSSLATFRCGEGYFNVLGFLHSQSKHTTSLGPETLKFLKLECK